MKYIPATTYIRGNSTDLGTRNVFHEEAPKHKVRVNAFFMDETEVTNAQFLKFTEETGYKTQAERGWSRDDFPNAPDEMLKAGAMVFTPTNEKIDPFSTSSWTWWKFLPGASWKHPLGPNSDITNKMNHPVVCITYEDAQAYAKWADKRLPTEAEWEAAARGGLKETIFTWGNDPTPENKWMANIFHGDFPHKDKGLDGFIGTAPAKTFPPNNYGLYDMAGNVWEICNDFYKPDYYKELSNNDISTSPQGPEHGITQPQLIKFNQTGTLPAKDPDAHRFAILHSTKGGSFLCHHSYCLRYRPAARHYTESLAPSNHTGFRCIRDITKK